MDAREILIDAAQRPIESTHQVLKGIDADVVNRMPDDTHSSIAWLIWHSGRQMDAQLAHLSGGEQVWRQDGWAERFALDRPAEAMGFGDEPADVAKVRVSDPALLSGYLEAAVSALCTYIRGLSDSDLDDVIGHMPGPISRGVRIVSIIDDGRRPRQPGCVPARPAGELAHRLLTLRRTPSRARRRRPGSRRSPDRPGDG